MSSMRQVKAVGEYPNFQNDRRFIKLIKFSRKIFYKLEPLDIRNKLIQLRVYCHTNM